MELIQIDRLFSIPGMYQVIFSFQDRLEQPVIALIVFGDQNGQLVFCTEMSWCSSSFLFSAAAGWYGMVNQKVDPFPSSDSTPMRPPMCSTIVWQMDSPSPVPLYKRVQFDETSEYGVHFVGWNAATGIFNIEIKFFVA